MALHSRFEQDLSWGADEGCEDAANGESIHDTDDDGDDDDDDDDEEEENSDISAKKHRKIKDS